MITIFVHRNGKTERVPSIDPALARPGQRGRRLGGPGGADRFRRVLILSDTFDFHPLSVEDAMAELHYPKIEAYDGYLYVILHGIDFQAARARVRDARHRLLPRAQLSRHRPRRPDARRSTELQRELRDGTPRSSAKGRSRCCTASSTRWSITTGRRWSKLEDRLDELEKRRVRAIRASRLIREILDVKRDVTALRRIVTPQRDVIGRLARREFVDHQRPRCRSASATSTIIWCG